MSIIETGKEDRMKTLKSVRFILFIFLSAGFFFLDMPGMKASGEPGRPVRVVSICFQGNDFSEILNIVDLEGAKGSDIIVLPETWRGDRLVETLDGQTITELSILAKKHNTYIISPIERREGDNRFNSAILIDRNGGIAGTYDKLYPYWNEFDLDPPVKPGIKDIPVFKTDFGIIGIAICYDANFPEVWQSLRDQGAEMVFWPSAYSAGTQLQAYALLHHYYIVTSTWTKDCQVYDITGRRILDENSGDITIARITLDLDRGIYHENFNMDKLGNLLKAHGDEVEKELNMPREQWFVLRAIKPGISARSLANKFGLEELTDYQDRSRKAIDKRRGYSFTGKLYFSEDNQ
jgi:predicted amidohydrolase